ncbi:MAG: hypothetical protein WC378_17010, partial [Opitutaceae bacterium]
KPTADSPGLPDFPKALRSPNGRSPTSDFLAGFRHLASGLFGCGSAALCFSWLSGLPDMDYSSQLTPAHPPLAK